MNLCVAIYTFHPVRISQVPSPALNESSLFGILDLSSQTLSKIAAEHIPQIAYFTLLRSDNTNPC